MMHQISKYLNHYNSFFTPYYADGYIDKLAGRGYLDFSILGGNAREMTVNYLIENKLRIDYKGLSHKYDLVLTCTDLIVQKNIRSSKIILVQEGMTDPKNLAYYLVKWFNLPRYLASTSTNGFSDMYDYFCVASEGYRDFFIKNGLDPRKVRITGIPNFDNCVQYYDNDFPYRHFVLVATSDTRETFKIENRSKFIKYCLEIANGRDIIFKLHPNEKADRATWEIKKLVPNAIVYHKGNVHEMIANCDVLITKYSTCVYTGLALGKKVYSDFDIDELKSLTPVQNYGTSAFNISQLCEELITENQLAKSNEREFSNVEKFYISLKFRQIINKLKYFRKYYKTS
jgi:hypothetical protein